MNRRTLVTAFTILVCLSAITAAQAPASPSEEILMERIRIMEGQVAALSAELERLKATIRNSKASADPGDPAAGNKGEEPRASAGSAADTSKAEQSVGVDIGNNTRLVPYGTVYFNAFANSSGTNNTDVPLWAAGSDQKNTGASLRQTRFGARIEGARMGGAAVTGVIEADFYGGLPAVGVGENFGVVRLRVAKLRLEWEKTSLTVGQDWIIFAPQNPVSIAAAAIPQFAASGNLWSRLPQARVERSFGKGRFLLQAAVLSPTSGDFPAGPDSPFLLQPGAASRSGVPSFESRVAYNGKNWFGTGKPGTLAASVHYGRASVADTGIGSYGVAADWSFPVAPRVGFAGEMFFGENLAGLQGGVFQGYNADFGMASNSEGQSGSVRSIRTRGGWAQVSFTPDVLRDRLTFYGSAGIDDPENDDLLSVTPRNWRSRNFSYAFNVIFKPIPQVSIGGEFRRFETTYFLTGKRTAEHFNLGAAYSF